MHVSYISHDAKSNSSSKNLIDYLEKENKGIETTHFFNQNRVDLQAELVSKNIDHNKGSHSKTSANFYVLNVSPSKKELAYIHQISLKEARIKGIKENTKLHEKFIDSQMKDYLTNYSREIMKEYAKNFNREIDGRPLNVNDIMYYGKIEKNRTYKAYDKQVRDNKKLDRLIAQTKDDKEKERLKTGYAKDKNTNQIIREGNQKGGLNYHAHIVVSRYDKTHELKKDKMSLSPMSKGKETIGFNDSKIGFSRDDFAQKSEITFDKMFDYQRGNDETYEYLKEKDKSKQLNDQGLIDKVVDGYVQDIKKDLGVKDIPTSEDLEYNFKYQMTNMLLEDYKSPVRIGKEFVSEVYDMTDKGVDLER